MIDRGSEGEQLDDRDGAPVPEPGELAPFAFDDLDLNESNDWEFVP